MPNSRPKWGLCFESAMLNTCTLHGFFFSQSEYIWNIFQQSINQTNIYSWIFKLLYIFFPCFQMVIPTQSTKMNVLVALKKMTLSTIHQMNSGKLRCKFEVIQKELILVCPHQLVIPWLNTPPILFTLHPCFNWSTYICFGVVRLLIWHLDVAIAILVT